MDGVVDISWPTIMEMQRRERMEKWEGDGIRSYVNGDQGIARTTQCLPAALLETGNGLACYICFIGQGTEGKNLPDKCKSYNFIFFLGLLFYMGKINICHC